MDPLPRARIVSRLPHEVRVIENLWIPMPDGARLAARVWLPAGAEASPVPAIVEYLPYRKRDGTRERDEAMHRWFAGHGWAALRIDLRGTGDSDGVLADEYTAEEHADGVAALRWIGAQAWCSGAVAMIGKSWGGFNALQIAALAPPELRAVVTVCSTDDRYADDAHYMGGCLLVENLTWGAVLQVGAALPPDPALVGASWRARWHERLAALPLYAARWLAHPRRDAYWRHGSVCEDYAAIRCPVLAVGGWADGYTNAVGRLVAGLGVPRAGLVGPWAHVYPHEGVPGPPVGFLQEVLRFCGRALDGAPADGVPVDGVPGTVPDPLYRAWMQEGVAPGPELPAVRPGRWVAEEAWPSPRIETRRLWLAAGGARGGDERDEPEGATGVLAAAPGRERALAVRSPQTVGLAAGAWCPFGLESEAPGDQRADDAGSLVFDSAPLAERLEILGAPEVELVVAADRPHAIVAVRLVDRRPDGACERVSYGLLNLCHRDGHEAPAPLVPGRPVRVRVRLNDAAHAFAPGHRLRVAVSGAYWPIAWPAAESTTLTVTAGASALDLPVRPPRAADLELRAFEPPECASAPPSVDLDPGGARRELARDPATGEVVYTVSIDAGPRGEPARSRLEPIDLVGGHAIVERFRIRPDDPLSARVEIEHRVLLERGDWSTRVETRTSFDATADEFRLQAELVAHEGGAEVCRRAWDERIPRDHV